MGIRSLTFGALQAPAIQRAILSVSFLVHRRHSDEISWVVGPDEIASMVRNLAEAIPRSHSVSLSANQYYDFRYGTAIPMVGPGKRIRMPRGLAGPWILGRLARDASGFLYVGATGFLAEGRDQRAFEFAWLKRHNKKIVCYFTGSDIRSVKLMNALQAETGIENIASYLPQVAAVFGTDAYDTSKRAIAAVADEYADVMFNAKVDQLAYLTRATEPFLYFFPDADFLDPVEKFDEPGRVVVVHAPSSPIIKGTQVVRAAIARLRDLGYEFEYVELIARPHDEVLAALRRAHIVLGEFYAFVPGVFGVEAMASGCALLTRADELLEPDLPKGSNEAWMVTPSSAVFDNLKSLLDDPAEMRALSARGQAWARTNAATSETAKRLRDILAKL